jgi:hypothetical protein
MSTNTLEIKGRQVLTIKALASGKNLPYGKDTKLAGKSYNQYTYNGTVFIVNTEDDFVSWKESGKLYSATFTEGFVDKEVDGAMTKVATLQLVGCTNIDQEISMATTEATLGKIYKDVEATAVNESIMDAITA